MNQTQTMRSHIDTNTDKERATSGRGESRDGIWKTIHVNIEETETH